MSVMKRDPHDRCGSTNGSLRCVKRPHAEDRHVGLTREGDPNTGIEWWDRQDRLDQTLPDAGPLIEAALRSGAPPLRPVSAPPVAIVPFNRVVGGGTEYTGDECGHCNSMRMVRTGHCSTCLDCGETSGCS